jgi:hypothetical protein
MLNALAERVGQDWDMRLERPDVFKLLSRQVSGQPVPVHAAAVVDGDESTIVTDQVVVALVVPPTNHQVHAECGELVIGKRDGELEIAGFIGALCVDQTMWSGSVSVPPDPQLR